MSREPVETPAVATGPVLRLRESGLDWRAIDGEVIALESETSTYLSTNDSGALLWERLAEGSTRDGLVTCLVDAFAIDRVTAAADVDGFVELLRERGLLES